MSNLRKNLIPKIWTLLGGLLIVGTLFLTACTISPAGTDASPTTQPDQTKPILNTILPALTTTESPTEVQPSISPSPEITETQASGPSTTETALPTGTTTPDPSLSPTATSTLAGIISTQAIQGTKSPPPDQVKLLKDILPSNGGYFAPNKYFQKSWEIQNTGTTTWTEKYKLVFSSGTAMNNELVFPIKNPVKPGKAITIVLEQVTPKNPGVYDGYWMLQNEKGKKFGTGPEANQPLPVKVTVLNISKDTSYDLLLEYCNATWWNKNGEDIKCPGEPKLIPGFVSLSTKPYLENGTSKTPVLWVHSNNILEGNISGRYPAYQVKDGDHFKAKVGCMGGYSRCNVTFKLLYRIGTNPVQTLGSWKELSGGGITTIDVNLSALQGQSVQFILRMTSSNNYPESAHGFWMTPRIKNILPTPLPPTAIPDTATPTETPTL